jgi:hypothetical protein
MISGIPTLIARVTIISVSRLTAAAENMQMPVASGPGPGAVLPASPDHSGAERDSLVERFRAKSRTQHACRRNQRKR